jgi:xanthine/CO dehydrogenase XdhC/CoxF family maturation factor
MTHNYNYDLATLQQLLLLPTPYIGVLGPKKKMDRMLEELREQGINPSDQQLAVVHGPCGLDLGSETAEEIALSIIAEIQAVLSKRQATPLREKSVSIHAEEVAAKP